MSKYWKDAASIIVIAKTVFTKNIPIKNPFNQMNKTERELNIYNYNVLALKRSSKNSYMADSYVFPGGNIETADSSKDWLELFKQSGVQESALAIFETPPRKHNVINIFESRNESELLKSISLRITGIRETFEESGILLCRSLRTHPQNNSKWASFLSGHQIQTWRKKVQENAAEFMNLCKHFECYPDIWSLKEWSNWLTPNNFAKRFNTIFFIVNLDQVPPTFCNTDEINDFKWSSPREIVDSCNRQEILLPPPQYYELSRLISFTDIEQLAEFTVHKDTTSSDLWMALKLKTSDGEITLLPGDDLYPTPPNYDNSPIQKVEKSLEELREQSNSLHRMEHTKKYNTRLLIKNISLNGNHILPQVTLF